MTLISIILKASSLLAGAACAQSILGQRASAAARHLMWTVVVLGVLLLPGLSTVMPRWTIVDLASMSASPTDDRVAAATSFVAGLAATVTGDVPGPSAAAGADASSVGPISWGEAATVLYAGGIVLLLGRLLAQRWSVQRLARRASVIDDPEWVRLLEESMAALGLRRAVTLLRSREQTMPMAFGTTRPAILLPAIADTWTEERRRAVLLHELAHVARHDCLTQTLAAVACAMYWVHPGVWWIARRLRIERELACDDRVLSAGADPRDYAGHLLELAYSLHPAAPALAVTMAAPGHLEGRLLALLDETRRRGVPRLRVRLAGLVVMTLLLVALAGVRANDSRAAAFAAGRAPALLAIQDPPPEAFEVASVRPNTSTETGGFIQSRPGGNFSVGNQTLQTLITFAYQLQRFQLIAPDWINTARYDIVAKAGRDFPIGAFGSLSLEAIMLRTLLADRFKLAAHRETREMPIYALVVARADGQLGPRLRRPSTDFCAQRRKAAATAPPPPMSADAPVCGIRGTGSELTAGSFPLSSFAGLLSGQVRRTVIDRTGLTGEWDFDLKWSPLDGQGADPDRPAIFTALQEQLGLKLEATTGPVEVLVIDRVERPMPD
jgi:uncharacterized protein (TIGR03435 family)